MRNCYHFFLVTIFSTIVAACGGGGSSNNVADTPQPVPNNAPIADAGENQKVDAGNSVTLNGSASTDPDDDPITFQWLQVAGPDVTLSDSTSATPVFSTEHITVDALIEFQLIVNDGHLDSAKDTVSINITAPIPFSISNIHPSDTATSIPRDTTINVSFNKKIESSIADYISLRDDRDNLVETTVKAISENRLTLAPKYRLIQDSIYTLHISNDAASIEGDNLAEAVATKFTTEKATWSTPSAFKAAGGYSRAATDSSGNAIIANWTYNEETSKYEITAFLRNGGEWDNGEVRSTALQVYSPTVAMNKNGDAILTSQRLFSDEIVVHEFQAGQWLPAWIINSADTENTVAFNDSGYAVITWLDGKNIRIAERKDGTWKHSLLATQTEPNMPQVKINSAGEGIIAWKNGGFRDENAVIYASFSNADGWGDPQQITAPADIQAYFSLAIDNQGDAVVTWQSMDETTRYDHAFKNEYRNMEWQGESALSPEANSSTFPQVSMNTDGSAVIAWGQTGTESGIMVQEYDGETWTLPHLLGQGGQPKLASTRKGDSVIFWEYNAGTHRELHLSQCNNGIWTEPTYFSSSQDTLNSVNHDLQVSESGDAIVVWSQSDSGEWYQYRSTYE